MLAGRPGVGRSGDADRGGGPACVVRWLHQECQAAHWKVHKPVCKSTGVEVEQRSGGRVAVGFRFEGDKLVT